MKLSKVTLLFDYGFDREIFKYIYFYRFWIAQVIVVTSDAKIILVP